MPTKPWIEHLEERLKTVDDFVGYLSAAFAEGKDAFYLAVRDVTLITYNRAATAALEQAAQWQPIKTAPKDGTDIFLWIPDGREIPIAGRWEPLVVSRKAKWVVDGGMLEDRFPLPTHWMPLPKPPIATIGDDKQ